MSLFSPNKAPSVGASLALSCMMAVACDEGQGRDAHVPSREEDHAPYGSDATQGPLRALFIDVHGYEGGGLRLSDRSRRAARAVDVDMNQVHLVRGDLRAGERYDIRVMIDPGQFSCLPDRFEAVMPDHDLVLRLDCASTDASLSVFSAETRDRSVNVSTPGARALLRDFMSNDRVRVRVQATRQDASLAVTWDDQPVALDSDGFVELATPVGRPVALNVQVTAPALNQLSYGLDVVRPSSLSEAARVEAPLTPVLYAFGSQLAVSEEALLVGVPVSDRLSLPNLSTGGVALLHVREPGGYRLLQTLESSESGFGRFVAIHGRRFAIASSGSPDAPAAVYLYEWGTDAPVRYASVPVKAGLGVGLSERLLAINEGPAIHVYELVEREVRPVAMLEGNVHALSGDRVVIRNTGSAKVHRLTAQGLVLEADLTAFEPESSVRAVALAEGALATTGEAFPFSFRRGVSVYHLEGGVWAGPQFLPDPENPDGKETGFGNSLAFVGPDVLAVGAPHEQLAGVVAGAVHVYHWNEETHSWSEATVLRASAAANGDTYASPLAGSSSSLAVGAKTEETLGEGSGAVYVYH